VININSELLLKIALTQCPLNPDQQVNHGCNLKWKLGQDEENFFLIHFLVDRQTDLQLK
jgi:hypothetical protein